MSYIKQYSLDPHDQEMEYNMDHNYGFRCGILSPEGKNNVKDYYYDKAKYLEDNKDYKPREERTGGYYEDGGYEANKCLAIMMYNYRFFRVLFQQKLQETFDNPKLSPQDINKIMDEYDYRYSNIQWDLEQQKQQEEENDDDPYNIWGEEEEEEEDDPYNLAKQHTFLRETMVCFNIWKTKGLCDVILVGKHQVKVPANKSILAAGSKVFERMFFGKSSTTTAATITSTRTTTSSTPPQQPLEEVKLDFDGHILKTVVEWIHTEESHIFLDILEVGSPLFMKHLASIIMLYKAGNFFGLPKLCERIVIATNFSVCNDPSIIFYVLEAFHQSGEDELADRACLSNLRNEKIKFSPHITAASNVAVLSPSVLEEILQDDNLAMTEFDLVKLLIFWATEEAEVEEANSTTTATTTNTTTTSAAGRLAIAKDLLGKYISLEKIRYTDLSSTTVESSQLVTKTQLVEVFTTHARSYDRGDNTLRGAFDKFRCKLSNSKSNNDSGQSDDKKKLPPSSSTSSVMGSEDAANQAVLASASKVFKKMLYENSKESQSTIATWTEEEIQRLDDILKATLKYVRNGTDPKMLKRIEFEEMGEKLPSLIQLEKVARLFHLKGLLGKVVQEIVGNIRSEEFQPHVTSSNVACLSSYLLEEIIKKNGIFNDMTEEDAFKLVYAWAQAGGDDRIAIAKEFVRKHISLQEIVFKELKTTVKDSGLATDDEIAVAKKARRRKRRRASL